MRSMRPAWQVRHAEQAGAQAAIVYDDVFESLIIMSMPRGHAPPRIPAVFVTQRSGYMLTKLLEVEGGRLTVRIMPVGACLFGMMAPAWRLHCYVYIWKAAEHTAGTGIMSVGGMRTRPVWCSVRYASCRWVVGLGDDGACNVWTDTSCRWMACMHVGCGAWTGPHHGGGCSVRWCLQCHDVRMSGKPSSTLQALVSVDAVHARLAFRAGCDTAVLRMLAVPAAQLLLVSDSCASKGSRQLLSACTGSFHPAASPGTVCLTQAHACMLMHNSTCRCRPSPGWPPS
jgi:hypothetical protein